jgi:hypothetical protein
MTLSPRNAARDAQQASLEQQVQRLNFMAHLRGVFTHDEAEEIVRRHPRIMGELTEAKEEPLKVRMAHFTHTLSLPPPRVRQLFLEHPFLACLTAAQLDAKLTALADAVDASVDVAVERIARRNPLALRLGARALRQQMQRLASELPSLDSKDALLRFPVLLTMDLSGALHERLQKWLRVFPAPRFDAFEVLQSKPVLLSSSVDKAILPRIELVTRALCFPADAAFVAPTPVDDDNADAVENGSGDDGAANVAITRRASPACRPYTVDAVWRWLARNPVVLTLRLTRLERVYAIDDVGFSALPTPAEVAAATGKPEEIYGADAAAAAAAAALTNNGDGDGGVDVDAPPPLSLSAEDVELEGVARLLLLSNENFRRLYPKVDHDGGGDMDGSGGGDAAATPQGRARSRFRRVSDTIRRYKMWQFVETRALDTLSLADADVTTLNEASRRDASEQKFRTHRTREREQFERRKTYREKKTAKIDADGFNADSAALATAAARANVAKLRAASAAKANTVADEANDPYLRLTSQKKRRKNDKLRGKMVDGSGAKKGK